MKLKRELTSKIRFILDEFLPPFVRDSKLFMIIPYKLLYGDKSNIFMDFKVDAFDSSIDKFTKAYRTASEIPSRITDLNEACIKEILNNVMSKSVLEIGCGNGYLAAKLSRKHRVTAVDIVINKKLIKRYSKIRFKKASIENLPFKKGSFDTVVCSHTLEHVQDIFLSISELRRVAKKRLIIVVPKQRPYRYTFDLHLHFFPYKYTLMTMMKSNQYVSRTCKELGGDLFYIENYY